jgi:hypothetical protein
MSILTHLICDLGTTTTTMTGWHWLERFDSISFDFYMIWFDCVRLFVCSFVCLFIYLFVCLLLGLCVYCLVCVFVCLFVCSCVWFLLVGLVVNHCGSLPRPLCSGVCHSVHPLLTGVQITASEGQIRLSHSHAGDCCAYDEWEWMNSDIFVCYALVSSFFFWCFWFIVFLWQ